MSDKIEHNLRDAERHIAVKATDLPKVITLVLDDGSKKHYTITFAKKAEGLLLSKIL